VFSARLAGLKEERTEYENRRFNRRPSAPTQPFLPRAQGSEAADSSNRTVWWQIYEVLPDSTSGKNGSAQNDSNGPARESVPQHSAGEFEDAPGSHAACVESEAQWKVALTKPSP
jgi:hypothetical protein